MKLIITGKHSIQRDKLLCFNHTKVNYFAAFVFSSLLIYYHQMDKCLGMWAQLITYTYYFDYNLTSCTFQLEEPYKISLLFIIQPHLPSLQRNNILIGKNKRLPLHVNCTFIQSSILFLSNYPWLCISQELGQSCFSS